MDKAPPQGSKLPWLALLAAPFLLNDLYNMSAGDFASWLAFDYVVTKALPLGLAWVLVRRGHLSWKDFGFCRVGWVTFAWSFVLALGLGWALDTWGWAFFQSVLPDTRLTFLPIDESSPLFVMDCLLGLALVGLVEEMVFRGLAWPALLEATRSRACAYALGAGLFGLIHWSQGLHAIVNTALIGLLFLFIRERTGSIWALVPAHFLINLISFCPCLWQSGCG